MIAIAITAIIGAVSVASFISFSRREALDASVAALAGGLRDARAQTLASVGGNRYGVAISADKFTFFQGSIYDPDAVTNKIFDFNSYVRASSTIFAVVFEKLTGNANASGTIDVYLVSDPAVKRSVGVSFTGLVGIE